MLVDASYLPWVRPTRRVHLAMSVGMTLTGAILAGFGIAQSRAVTPPPASVNRPVGSSVVSTEPESALTSAVIARLITPPVVKPSPSPSPNPSHDAKPEPKPKAHVKPRPRPHPAPPTPATHAAPAPVPTSAPAPRPVHGHTARPKP